MCTMVEDRTMFGIEQRLNPEVEHDMKGMMDRDQRTVLNRHENICKNTNENVLQQSRRRNRVGQALALGACLLSIVRFPTVMAAPTRQNGQEKAMFWVNPCGNTDYRGITEYDSNEMYHYDEPKIVVNPIILVANNSLTFAQDFRDDYVQKTFQHSFAKQLEMWPHHYDWLPQLPKSLGEPTSIEHLESLKINDVLIDTYEYLQKIAVGVEQMVEDQNKTKDEFLQKFDKVVSGLRSVLCEIQGMTLERNITTRPNVERSIMDKYRNLDETGRKLRDWVIFRDYMNCLEYVIEVFQYFGNNPSKLGPS